MTRNDLYDLLKTILDPSIFSFNDTTHMIGAQYPISADSVRGLADFVKQLLANGYKPSQQGQALEIMGGYISHDSSLTVNKYGELSVALIDGITEEDPNAPAPAQNYEFDTKDFMERVDGDLLKISLKPDSVSLNTILRKQDINSASQVDALKNYVDEQLTNYVKL